MIWLSDCFNTLYKILIPIACLAGYLLTHSPLLRVGTTSLCLLLVLLLLIPKPRNATLGWIVAAFALSIAGDCVLNHWGGSFLGFVIGVVLFLMAHVGYILYSLCHGSIRWWLFALLTLLFGSYYLLLLRPQIGDAITSLAVFAYILVSCLSLAAAAGLRGSTLVRILFIAGIASLLFSDFLIAQKRFLGDGTLYALMMPTYFASQILVTASLLAENAFHRHTGR